MSQINLPQSTTDVFCLIWTVYTITATETAVPGPRTYLSRQRMQSTAALAKTTTLSVARNTSNTSSTAATCCCRDSFTSSFAVYSIFTARNAPNNGFQPLRMLDVHASTNSQMEQTTWHRHDNSFVNYWCMHWFSNYSSSRSWNSVFLVAVSLILGH